MIFFKPLRFFSFFEENAKVIKLLKKCKFLYLQHASGAVNKLHSNINCRANKKRRIWILYTKVNEIYCVGSKEGQFHKKQTSYRQTAESLQIKDKDLYEQTNEQTKKWYKMCAGKGRTGKYSCPESYCLH